MNGLNKARYNLREEIASLIANCNGPCGPTVNCDIDKALDAFAEAIISETFYRLHATKQLRSDE